jgi:hypothetical protein
MQENTMAKSQSLVSKLVSDSLPVLVSAFIFINLVIVLGVNPHNLMKAAYIAVIAVGLWNLVVRRGKNCFSSRLFSSMLVFGVAGSLVISTSFAVTQGFSATVTTGNFIADMLLSNYLYAPWTGYLVILCSYLLIYGLYQGSRKIIGR